MPLLFFACGKISSVEKERLHVTAEKDDLGFDFQGHTITQGLEIAEK